jgi:hypothetical protein
MNTNCCETSVPHRGSSKALDRAVGAWQERLQARLSRSIEAGDQTMGHLEEEIFEQTRELERVALVESVQKKADQVPPVCPVCGASPSNECLTSTAEYTLDRRIRDS